MHIATEWLQSLSVSDANGSFPLPNVDELRLAFCPDYPEVPEHVGRLRSLGLEEDSDDDGNVYYFDEREDPDDLADIISWEQAAVELLLKRPLKTLSVPRFSLVSREKVPKHVTLEIRDVGQVSVIEHFTRDYS